MSLGSIFEDLLAERKAALDLNSTNKDYNYPVFSKDALAASRFSKQTVLLQVNETYLLHCGKVFILTNKTVINNLIFVIFKIIPIFFR